MEPNMHSHSGPVDHSLASFLGTDTGFVAAKLPPKSVPESGTIDPASESIVGGSTAMPILPRWNEPPTRETENEDQEKKQARQDHSRRHNIWRPKPLDSPENGIQQDTVDDWSRIVDMQAIDDGSESNNPPPAIQIEKRDTESLGHRFTAQVHSLLDHKANPNPKMQSLGSAPWSSSPFTYEIHAIDSPNTITASPIFQQPVFWLALLALFFCCALILDLDSLFYKVVAKWNRKSGVRGGKRAGSGRCGAGDERRMLVDEEATWEFADAR